MFNVEKTANECIEWIRDWFERNGKGCNAIVGISGGKDSSVTAALCVKALGKDRVIGVLMPNHIQSDISDSKLLCEFLGIRNYTVDIGAGVDALMNNIKDKTGIEISEQTIINMPARIRMTTLYGISQSLNGRVANTCNLSEDYVGYATKYGDAAGDFGPLSNLTKGEVVEIGDYLGLPKQLTHKTPSDGLCGKSDEDNLGFTYEVLDRYIRTGECEDEEVKALIERKHKANLFKLELMETFKF